MTAVIRVMEGGGKVGSGRASRLEAWSKQTPAKGGKIPPRSALPPEGIATRDQAARPTPEKAIGSDRSVPTFEYREADIYQQIILGKLTSSETGFAIFALVSSGNPLALTGSGKLW